MVGQCFPFVQTDMDDWYKRHQGKKKRLEEQNFAGDIELFNRLCVMFDCTDSDSFDDAMERIMISLKNMGED